MSAMANPRSEYRDRAKKIFIESEMSLPALASMSKQLIGIEIPVGDLKEWSKRDPNGSWEVARAKHKAENSSTADLVKQVSHIIQIAYTQIVAESVKGLTLIGDFDREEVKKRLEGVPGLEILEIGGKVNPTLFTAFMTLLDKSGIKISNMQANRMVSREQGLAAIRDEIEKMRNGKAENEKPIVES